LKKYKTRKMSEEFENLDEFEVSGSPAALPNATAVLVLGILSIVTCWLYGIPGIIMGIIAISMHKKDKALYLSNKTKYGQSFKNSKAGFICGIIGLSLSALWIIYLVVVLLFVAGAVATAGSYNGYNGF
jgi:hypothetical protein